MFISHSICVGRGVAFLGVFLLGPIQREGVYNVFSRKGLIEALRYISFDTIKNLGGDIHRLISQEWKKSVWMIILILETQLLKCIHNNNTLTGQANCKKTTRHHVHLSLCAKWRKTNDAKSRKWLKTSIRTFFWRFRGQISPNRKFFWKIGFIQIEGHN